MCRRTGRSWAPPAGVPEWSALQAWEDPWPHVGAGGYSYAVVGEESHPGLERPWFEYLVPAAGLEGRWRGVRWPVSGRRGAADCGVAPRWGAETDDKTIPHELDLLRTAVHLNKGCYKGQETVARVHNLGHPPRRLVFLQLDGSQHTMPAPGSEVRPVTAGSAP